MFLISFPKFLFPNPMKWFKNFLAQCNQKTSVFPYYVQVKLLSNQYLNIVPLPQGYSQAIDHTYDPGGRAFEPKWKITSHDFKSYCAALCGYIHIVKSVRQGHLMGVASQRVENLTSNDKKFNLQKGGRWTRVESQSAEYGTFRRDLRCATRNFFCSLLSNLNSLLKISGVQVPYSAHLVDSSFLVYALPIVWRQ